VRRASPERVLAALPEPARPLVERILREAERRQLGVLLVGGPVRDLLLGRGLRDVDLVVEAGGKGGAEDLARAAAPRRSKVVAHARFGTAHLEIANAGVDLATARTESYPRPGALPEVRPGTLEEDLRRRDFTVNGMAIPLTPAARHGRQAVVDPASGLADLEAGTLRVFHPESFRDDPTRALRAARLALRLDFRLSRGSHRALRAALRDGVFGAVTGERFRAELEKLFADAALGLDPARAFRQLSDWHVLAALEPGLTLAREAGPPLRRLGRNVRVPPWPPREARVWLAGWMLWLAPLDASLRRRTLRRLAVRGEPGREIAGFPAWRDGRVRALARGRGRGACDAALAGIPEHALLALTASASAAERRRILRWAREDRLVELPVDGDDLTAIGLRGPAVGTALARIRAAFLDREVRTRDEALALAREVAHRAAARSSRGPRSGR
jgi:tRNA nucleotidyltransferase (CCA-adding enzyme)